MSYKSEVLSDSSGVWASNGLRFATKAEAMAYGSELADRWTSVRDMRVVTSDEPVTHRWNGHKAEPLP